MSAAEERCPQCGRPIGSPRMRRLCRCVTEPEFAGAYKPELTPFPIGQFIDDGLTLRQRNCKHGVEFNAEAWRAGNYTPAEVRDRWPRHYGTCKRCGWEGIAYASREHYVAGDW